MAALFAPIIGPAEFDLDVDAFASPFSGGVLAALQRSASQFLGNRATVGEATRTGDEVRAFSGDFFDRVHYGFTSYDFGNVVGLQSKTLSVWNAFRRAERLNAIVVTNGDGVTFTGGPILPSDFAPLGEAVYTFEVSPEGPANLAATYAFDWATTDATVEILGVRVTAWSFLPDWTNGVVERMEWATNVIQSYNAKEQRRALRLAPRKTYEFEATFEGDARRLAEANAWGWGARVWALPVWNDGSTLAANLPAGSTVVPVETAGRDYVVGGLAIFIGSAFAAETVEIAAVGSDSITLTRPTSTAWPQHTNLFPARSARLAQTVNLSRFTGDVASLRTSFNLDDPVDYTPAVGPTLYRSAPVLTRVPNWSGGLDVELSRKLAELDSMTGRRIYDDEAGIPLPVQRMSFTLTSKAEQAAMRGLLYALKGRQGGVWVPSWARDLRVAAVIDLAAMAIEVAFCGYSRQIAAGTGRRDVRIELSDGTVYFRRILSASQLANGNERLIIDAALGRTVEPFEVAVVSFMTLCRLESDAVEFAHWTGDVCDLSTSFRGYQHDL